MKPSILIFLFVLLLPQSSLAQKNVEAMCAYTVSTPDGQFRLVPSDSLHVLEQVTASRKFALPSDAPKNTVAINCARTSPLPVVGDALVLKAGFGLYIASSYDGLTSIVVSLKLLNNRVTLDQSVDDLTARQVAELQEIVDEMNATYFTAGKSRS